METKQEYLDVIAYRDVLSVILSFVHPYEYNQIKGTCKLFYRILRGLRDNGLQLVLTPAQKQIVNDICLAPRDAIIQAPLSFGKTITALALSMRFLRSIIVVPSTLIEQWIKEAKKMYGENIYDIGSLGSPILVYNQKISPLHHRKIKYGFKENVPLPKIIIASTASLRYMASLIRNYSPELLIIDECQKGDNVDEAFYHKAANYHLIGLTASINYRPPKPFGGDIEMDIIVCKREEVTDYIPEYKLNYNIYEESFSFAGLGQQIEALNLKGYTIVYYLSCYFGTLTHDKVQQHFKSPIYFHLDPDHYENFSLCPEEKNPILVYSYERGCEGLNLNHIQNMVLLSPNRVNYQRINQAIGRSLRVTNPNQCIRVEAMIPYDEVEQAVAYVNLIDPHVYQQFLTDMKVKKPGFNFNTTRWNLYHTYGLGQLEYYILFHTNRAYNKVEDWCKEKDLFSHIPFDEFSGALRCKHKKNRIAIR